MTKHQQAEPEQGFVEQDARSEYGYLPMLDGTRLAYVVWRPRKRGRYPTVLHYSAYAESGVQFEAVKRFLEAGYAYVGVNVRGTGSSEGVYSYYQPIEGPDGAEVVEWAAAQPWSTGNVGMIGSSYGGHTQIKVAALQPPHLKAIVPIATEGSEYRDEGMAGGLFNAGLLGHWTFRVQPDMARTGAEDRMKNGGDKEGPSIRENQPENAAFYEVLQHPLYDEWWHARSLDTMAGQVNVPTLIMHAWQDEWIRPNGAARLFKLLGSEHKRLVFQNGPHGLGVYPLIQREQIRWLDRWVKGESNGVEAEAPVTVFWEVQAPDGDRTRAVPSWTTTYSTWPAPNLKWSLLYLTASGELSGENPDTNTAHGILKYLYPMGTELVGNNEQFAQAPYPLGALSYRTAPMTADMSLLGSPQLTLYFSCEQTDTDFMFMLKDIDPAGNTLFLQRTVLRASMRRIDRARSTPDELIQFFTEKSELVPGEIYEVTLSLSAIGHVARKGHQIELSILAPSPTPNPVWGFLPISAPSLNAVYHSTQYPSTLLLPVVPGETAQAPAPECGTLENQPCRTR
jgi:putative CocE/NonD family hydrolase